MKVQTEEISSTKKQVEVFIPEDRVAQVYSQVVRDVKKQAKIPGFRPGKIPTTVLERYYKHEIDKEITSRLVGDTFDEALSSQGITAVALPLLEKSERISEDGFGFRYTLEVEIKPKFDPVNYIGLKVDQPVYDVTTEDVEAELTRMREQRALLRTIEEDRPIREGDLALIDIQGKIDGKAFDGGTSENFLIEIGSGRFLPGLEEGLIGLRSNSTKEITVTLPEDFDQKEIAGKPAVFSVKVKELKEKKLPDLDDEFAKEFGEFKTLQELKDKIMEEFKKRAERSSDDAVRESILEQLRKENQIELPPSLVAEEGKIIYNNLLQRLAPNDPGAEIPGLDKQDMMKRCIKAAESRVHASLILEAIAPKEGLTVTDEELDEEIKISARQTKTTAEHLKKDLEEKGALENLRSRMLEDKTLDFLKEKATLNKVKKTEKQDDKNK